MDFIQIIQDIILGIVQGLTEFLPVSSSGHLTIAQHLMNVKDGGMFLDVMLHIGTLVAVFIFYRKLIWRLIKSFFALIGDIFTGKFKWKNMTEDQNMLVMLIIGLIPLFLLFIPIPGTNMNIKDLADLFAGDKAYFIVVGFSLLVTCLLLTLGIHCNKKLAPTGKHFAGAKHGKNENAVGGRTRYGVLDAVVVGLGQCAAAVFPGLSRSGTTLALGQVRGINKQSALDYTFILGIPSILAAAALEVKDIDTATITSSTMIAVVFGMIAAAVVGYFALVLFKWLLKTDRMFIFAIYTAVLAVIVIVIGAIELATGHLVSFF